MIADLCIFFLGLGPLTSRSLGLGLFQPNSFYFQPFYCSYFEFYCKHEIIVSTMPFLNPSCYRPITHFSCFQNSFQSTRNVTIVTVNEQYYRWYNIHSKSTLQHFTSKPSYNSITLHRSKMYKKDTTTPPWQPWKSTLPHHHDSQMVQNNSIERHDSQPWYLITICSNSWYFFLCKDLCFSTLPILLWQAQHL